MPPANTVISDYCVLTFHLVLNKLHTLSQLLLMSLLDMTLRVLTLMHTSVYNSDYSMVPAACQYSIMIYFMSNSSSVSLHRLEPAGGPHELPSLPPFRLPTDYLSSHRITVTIGHEF
jgi:hypothetical protein